MNTRYSYKVKVMRKDGSTEITSAIVGPQAYAMSIGQATFWADKPDTAKVIIYRADSAERQPERFRPLETF